MPHHPTTREAACRHKEQSRAQPALRWNLSKSAQVYAFVQVPLYQAVNGVQLTADWSALAGVSWRF